MHIGLGTASFGTSISEKSAHQVMNAFVEHGGVIIDTANNYAFWAGKGGESEAVIGNWLLTTQREKVEIHTKIGAQPTDGNSFETAEGCSGLMNPDTSERDNMIINRGVYEQEKNVQKLYSRVQRRGSLLSH